ncbi:MAG: proline dehydrogenase family protein [Pseudomonadota bacterium]
MSVLTVFAKRFVAGENITTAISAVKKINEKGISATLDILGENVSSRQEAEKACESYLELLRNIEQSCVNSNVSLKLTQMGLDIDDEFCYENVKKIVDLAASMNNFVRIDMEGSDYTSRTLSIFYRLRKEYDNVGIVIQSMLKRTENDINDISALNGGVRICKGAYKEPSTVAYLKMPEIKDSFKKALNTLLKNNIHTAVATHDNQLIEEIKNEVLSNGIDRDLVEFQVLYGIKNKMLEKLAEEGYNTRIYVPFGTHWFPYFYRRIRERKENLFFILKNIIHR